MPGFNFSILLILCALAIYLLLRIISGKNKSSPGSAEKVDHKPQIQAKPSSTSSISPGTDRGKPGLPLSTPWQPLVRSQVEVETIWRLEHVLRELPDLGETPIINIDYSMEPREIALIIASNPFYAARIIKTINSAAFGLHQKIDSLQRAITYLGYNEVKNIIFQHAIHSNLSKMGSGEGNFDHLQFWKHSHAVSVCAEFILRDVLQSHRNVGLITTAALLHDIGWVIYYYYDQEAAAGLFSRLKGNNEVENPIRQEEEVFGFNHLIAGKMLAEHWKMSSGIGELIGLHHCGTFGFTDKIDRDTAFGACVITKAEELSYNLGFPNPVSEPRDLVVDISGVIGAKASALQEGILKLRDNLEKTMNLIEEFRREE